MLNKVVIVGRLVKEPTKDYLVISVSRNYKNKEGVYDEDIVKVYHNMPSIIEQNIHTGDLVGINGKLETENNEIKIKSEKIIFNNNKM